jgi:ATP-dependent RNA helicase DDX46/PRP5
VQIFTETKRFAKPIDITPACAYGGAPISEQVSVLKAGAEIVVATPGRAVDLLCLNNGRVTNLSRVTYLVLDEADRMFDMGFEPQVIKIVNNIRPDRQTVLFSATFPKVVEKHARAILMDPVQIICGGGVSVVSDTIDQHIEIIDEHAKITRLLAHLTDWYEKGCILIFVDRQDEADELFRDLLKNGYPGMTLHGGKDQSDRDNTIADFKSKHNTLLVATSVAARGLHVNDLVLVVNYNCPNHYEDYVHRVGRTGRAGNLGTAYTFVTPEDEAYAGDMIKALKNAKLEVPEDLQALKNRYERSVKEKEAQGITVYRPSSGYRGPDPLPYSFIFKKIQKI